MQTMTVPLWLLVAAFPGPTSVAAFESSASSVAKGMFLVASPSLNDPNFHHTVVLVVEHSSQGTLGLVLNRPTNMLLWQALPELGALKDTDHRLFAGGPVQPGAMLLLSRTKEPQEGLRLVFDSVYVGGTPELLERLIRQPTSTFRAFAGYVGWGPGQLGLEMRQGAWGVLSGDSAVFEQDPATLWQDSLARLQAPGVVSN